MSQKLAIGVALMAALVAFAVPAEAEIIDFDDLGSTLLTNIGYGEYAGMWGWNGLGYMNYGYGTGNGLSLPVYNGNALYNSVTGIGSNELFSKETFRFVGADFAKFPSGTTTSITITGWMIDPADFPEGAGEISTDGNGDVIGGSEVFSETVTLTSDMVRFDSAYANTDINVLQISGYPARAQIMMDNLEIVPEPATLSLLVLGGLAMLRRRRA